MMAKMALLFPAQRLSDAESTERLELYTELLCDIPFDILSAAFKSVAQTSRFFPTVAEIRAAAAEQFDDRRSEMWGIKRMLTKYYSHPEDQQPCITEEEREAVRKGLEELVATMTAATASHG